MTRLLAALLVSALALVPMTPVWAQTIPPPSAWHPYRGGTNCLQVADVNGNFNCAPGTTVDPTTGNMVVGGSISFGSAVGTGTYFGGVVIGPITTLAQVLGTGDLVLSTSPPAVAKSGPLLRGVTIRVRQGPGGSCQLVVAGGNGFQEFVIPVLTPYGGFIAGTQEILQPTFPGGPAGC